MAVTLNQAAAETAAETAGEAAERSYPWIEGSVSIEIQNDYTVDSDDRDSELNDLYTTTEPEIITHLAPGLSITAHGVLEPLEDPRPRNDRAFEDHGIFVEDLFLTYAQDQFTFKGGKFTPNFGRAWDMAPGVYGTDVAEDNYEFAERIGIEGSISFSEEKWGAHHLAVSTFFLDTSFLTEAFGTDRGRVRLNDGGVSNTEDFSSFAVSLDGGEIESLPGIAYHLAYIQQAEADQPDLAEGTGVTDETGFVASLDYTFAIPTAHGDIECIPFVEFVHFDDFQGMPGIDRDFLTTSVSLGYDQWNMAFSRTGYSTDGNGDNSGDETYQISAGYGFECGLSLDLGWKTGNEDGVQTDVIGGIAAYTIEF